MSVLPDRDSSLYQKDIKILERVKINLKRKIQTNGRLPLVDFTTIIRGGSSRLNTLLTENFIKEVPF